MSRLINLVNQKFNRLTVIEKTESKSNTTRWICKCDCGNTSIVTSVQLKSGKTKSCGCYNKEQVSNRTLIDLSGKRFGKLTIINRGKTVGKSVYWNVVFDCGIEKQVLGGHLRNSGTISCGCIIGKSNFKDISGQTFGILTVIEVINKDEAGYYIWKCECKCGNIISISGKPLRNGNTKSCGCRRRKNQTYGTIYGIYDKHNILKYVGQTTSDNLEYRLSSHLLKPSNNQMKNWLNSLDYKPIIKPIVENVKVTELNKVEKEVISLNSTQYNLLNYAHNKEVFDLYSNILIDSCSAGTCN